jgi:hypothetical protein
LERNEKRTRFAQSLSSVQSPGRCFRLWKLRVKGVGLGRREKDGEGYAACARDEERNSVYRPTAAPRAEPRNAPRRAAAA